MLVDTSAERGTTRPAAFGAGPQRCGQRSAVLGRRRRGRRRPRWIRSIGVATGRRRPFSIVLVPPGRGVFVVGFAEPGWGRTAADPGPRPQGRTSYRMGSAQLLDKRSDRCPVSREWELFRNRRFRWLRWRGGNQTPTVRTGPIDGYQCRSGASSVVIILSFDIEYAECGAARKERPRDWAAAEPGPAVRRGAWPVQNSVGRESLRPGRPTAWHSSPGCGKVPVSSSDGRFPDPAT